MLNGRGKRLARVSGFCSSQTDQFGSREGEGGVDEGAAETFEAVVECSRVSPVLATNVGSIGSTANIDDYSEDDEADYCGYFDDGEYEFRFSVAFDAEQIDTYNED